MTMDVNVHLINFPNTKEREIIVENEDGSYSIFVNAKYTRERCLEAYLHALDHIGNNDFQGRACVQEIESRAHELN